MTTPTVGSSRFFAYMLTAILIGGFVVTVPTSYAAEKSTKVLQRNAEIQVGSSTSRISLFTGTFKGGATIATADVNADGVDEYIVGAGPKGGPLVEVRAADGSLMSSFYAFDKKLRTGITVAAGNVDGNGATQIVVAQQAGGTSEVRVFTWQGTLERKFNAFEANYVGGMNVAIAAGHNNSGGYIIVGSGFGRENEVRAYTASGSQVISSISPFGTKSGNGVTVAGGWSDTYNQHVIVVGGSQGDKPLVQVYGLLSEKKLGEWLAYDKNVKTGINVAFRADRIATGPSLGGGPDMRMYSMTGTLLSSTLVFENNFRGGVRVAVSSMSGSLIPVAVPTSQSGTGNGAGKRIVVSLSKQTLTMYENGSIVSLRRVSTGKWSTPTPPGTYRTYNKITSAYSKAYGLYMEYWMAFTPDGSMGLHSLPYWKLKNGGRLYEGAAHIGTPVSHGCIRQTLAEAKSLYDWAPVGTPVVIEK